MVEGSLPQCRIVRQGSWGSGSRLIAESWGEEDERWKVVTSEQNREVRKVDGRWEIRGIKPREDVGSRGWSQNSSAEEGSRQNWLAWGSDQENPIEWACTRQCRYSVCSRNSPQPCLDPPKSEWHDGQRQINEAGKCIRENTALRSKFRGGVRVQACHAAVWLEFAFWPLRRDYHSGVLIGEGGRRRSDWPARVLANDVSTRIDR